MKSSDRDAALERDKALAFATLAEVGRALQTGDGEAGADAARRLAEIVLSQDEGEARAGFGTMGLDAAFWLLADGRDADALALGDALAARFVGGSATDQAVAAGADFLCAQAAARLRRPDRARAYVEALCGLGEPALAALDRLTTRLIAAGAEPAWHAQLAAASVTVLWRLGRRPEAHAIAEQAAAAFTRAGEPTLARMMLDLGRELAAQ